MLVERKYTNKHKQEECIYICDRCKTELTIKTRYQLAIAKPNTDRREKYADLCPKCMKAFHRAIKRGVKNDQSGSKQSS